MAFKEQTDGVISERQRYMQGKAERGSNLNQHHAQKGKERGTYISTFLTEVICERGRQTDRQTDRQKTDRDTMYKTDRRKESWTNGKKERQAGKQADK